jgi:hypothetical protein
VRLLKTIATLDERITPQKIKYFHYFVVILYVVLNSVDIYAAGVFLAYGYVEISPFLYKVVLISNV